MTVLITGGAGYIGSHVAKMLHRQGRHTLVIDDLSEGYRQGVKWSDFEQVDLRDLVALRQVFRRHRIEAVMHFAAKCLVGESMHEPHKYYDNNVLASFNLLTCMLEAKVFRLIFSSTCAAYGEPESVPISEVQQPKPISVYGRTKYQFEVMLQDHALVHPLQYVCFRYFNAAGADRDGDSGEKHDPETHLVPLVIEAALDKDRPLVVFGNDFPTPDGTGVRDYLHVEDIAAAHLLGLAHLEAKGGNEVFNLGCGKGYSVLEIIAKVEEHLGMEVPYEMTGRRAGDPPELIADFGKAKRILGWEPRVSDLDTVIATATTWRRSKEYSRFVRTR